MKTPSQFVVCGALAAVAIAASGCRTVHSSDSSYYPKPKTGTETPADEVEKPVAPVAVSGDTAAPGASVANGAAPAPVQDASVVGTPGTYREFVITDEGADRSYMFESEGLKGQTGHHVPKPTPSLEPEAAPTPAPAGSGYYVVQAGDIFGRIARKHGVSEKALREANPSVKDPNKIHVGQKLAIPAAGTGAAKGEPAKTAKPQAAKAAAATLPEKPGYTVYVVKDGDILGRIAKHNGTTVKAIMEANGISDERKLRAGKPIYIPTGAPAAIPEAKAEPPAPAPADEPVEDSLPAPEPEVPSDPYLVL